jgi:hypothetical protein
MGTSGSGGAGAIIIQYESASGNFFMMF